MARRSRKTEANREKERESQDEPIVEKLNAHGARGELLRGLVCSRVGNQYTPWETGRANGLGFRTVTPSLRTGNRASPTAQSVACCLGNECAGITVSQEPGT